MKNNKILLCLPFMLMTVIIQAQNIKITSLESIGNDRIELVIESDTELYFGALDYYLYIGNQELANPYITNENGKGKAHFCMNNEQFGKLPNSTTVILNYGRNPRLKEINLEGKSDAKIPPTSKYSYNIFNKNTLDKKN